MSDFSILLREQPAAAIAERLDYLEAKAKAARLDLESAKLSSFALAVLGLGLSANPLVGLLGGIGAIGYAGALVADYMATGRFCPVPALRKGVGELLAGFSAHGDDDQDPDMAEVEALASCLPPREAKEFWLLSLNSDRLLDHLLSQSPEQRLNGYGLAVRSPRVLAKAQPAQQLPPAPVPQLPAPPPQPPAPGVGPATRLGAIAVPAQPVPDQQWDDDEPLEASQGPGDLARLRDALGYPAVLIFGASGAGKSTLARWFVAERLALGHQIEILDPHAAYGAWGDLPVYGAALDFEACNDRLKAFAELVRSRYQSLAKRATFNPRPFTVLVEEFTNWANHCPAAGDFFSSSMSDLRKVNAFALYVAHGKTLKALGGSNGTASQRDASLLMIELDTKMGPDGRPIPAGRGRIYYPGRHDAPAEIVMPTLSESPIPAAAKQQQLCNLESAFSADSSDDLVAAVREILIKAGEPLRASQIKQRSRMFKDGMETKRLEEILDRMAMEGFVVKAGETPPRFSVS